MHTTNTTTDHGIISKPGPKGKKKAAPLPVITLRDYQKTMVDKGLTALERHGNSLLIAPTGAGKTWALSALIDQFLKTHKKAKVLVLQHRGEIFHQNREKFQTISPSSSVSFYHGDQKDFSAEVVFSMCQTLMRDHHLEKMPHFDLVVVDETHHIAAPGYGKILERLKALNPDCKLLGVTATPLRGDRKTLGQFFTNVGHQIYIHTLIKQSYLVRPRTFVIDLGFQGNLTEFFHQRKKMLESELDDYTSKLMGTNVSYEKLFEEWWEKAGTRKTVIFCPNVKISQEIREFFNAKGVKAFHLDHTFKAEDRVSILNAFENDPDALLLSNAMLLTEGWDCPSVSCVILFKTTSYKSTYLQMIGRGLRLHPGKEDCIILDFGISSLIHQTLEQQCDNVLKKMQEKETIQQGDSVSSEDYKPCPSCKSFIPDDSVECSLCGYVFPDEAAEAAQPFSMVEIDIMGKSPFAFGHLREDLIVISSFDAFIILLKGGNPLYPDLWFAGGGFPKNKAETMEEEKLPVFLKAGLLEDCLTAANAFMDAHSHNMYALKDRSWLYEPPTEKQLAILKDRKIPFDDNLNRYQASCWIEYLFNGTAFKILFSMVSLDQPSLASQQEAEYKNHERIEHE